MKPCPSKDKAPIYLATVRVAFKKAKRTYERVVQVVTVFDTPHDIMEHGKHTMKNLEEHLYGKTYKSQKQVIVREVLDKKFISNSNLTIDEHKKQYQE
jgi:precorrin-4 methylase